MGTLGITELEESLDFLRNQNFNPDIGIVLGSGLGKFIESCNVINSISYKMIPHFPETSIEGHDGLLHLCEYEGKKLAILQGRVHAYEGKGLDQVVFPIRALGLWGVKQFIITNASGGINLDYTPGEIVLIQDHLNLLGDNPLKGPNITELGPRFPDMTEAYCSKMKDSFIKGAKEHSIDIKCGVYAGLLGPTYETPAEIKMLRTLGADMVGMSTVAEVIAANHMGIKVTGLSCITNMAAGILSDKLSHEEVKDTALKSIESFSKILLSGIKQL
ncbi:MAG: purine-nucleoside phosphorylase [Bdellovibrionales bacterium]|nr:purine-nucleoside phosphorylase [Bdellovibrionales bacterium]